MILSISGAKSEPKTKKKVEELHMKTPLLRVLPAARNHLAERSQTTDPTGGAST